jgi:ubiquinone/menaquinone biosynthesis C-methylase UbiE
MLMDTDQHLDKLGFFKDGFKICDIGCGVGYIPEYLVKHAKKVDYLGIDVDMGVIQHCKNRFSAYGYEFKRLNVRSAMYNPLGTMDAEFMKLDLPDESLDSVICHSLFTHLDTEAIASRYMSEIKRVLKPGGLLWTTWFTSPPNKASSGTIRTVYSAEFISSLFTDLKLLHAHGGESDDYHDQLYVASQK